MQMTPYQYFDTFFRDETVVGADNQKPVTFIQAQLQIKASSNTIIDTKVSEIKEILESNLNSAISFLPWNTSVAKYPTTKDSSKLPSKEKAKYLKGYKAFSDKNGQEKTMYLRMLLKIKEANIDLDFFNDVCQECVNDFSSTAASGWITHIRLQACTSEAIQPCILCLLVHVPQEFEDWKIFSELLREITEDDTIGLKFNSYNVPKVLNKKLNSSDWTLRKVLQVEGERQLAQRLTKAIKITSKRIFF